MIPWRARGVAEPVDPCGARAAIAPSGRAVAAPATDVATSAWRLRTYATGKVTRPAVTMDVESVRPRE